MVLFLSIKTGQAGFTAFTERFNIWDAGWYQVAAENLFTNPRDLWINTNGQAVWAFFPLYPLLAGLVCKVFPFLTFYKAGTILSSVFMMAGEYVACRYIRLTRSDRRLPYWYIALMSFGPYSVYFSIAYTEALFILLLALCFYYMEKGAYIRMGLSGALLSATRNVGVFFCLALLVFWIVRYLRRSERRSLKGFFLETFRQPRLILGAVMIPAGLFAWMLFLKIVLGDTLAFVHVQHAWGKEYSGLFVTLWEHLVHLFPPDYYGVAMLAFLALIFLIFFENHRYAEGVFPAVIFLIAGTMSAISIPRYMMGTFGIPLALTDTIGKMKPVRKILCFGLLFFLELLIIRAWIDHSSWLV